MISSTPEYKAAIIGDSRRMYIKANLLVADPDIVYGTVGGSTQLANVSKQAQLHDNVLDLDDSYITLERNRWTLDGTFVPFESMVSNAETGFVTSALSGSDGTCSFSVEMNFSGVSILKTCAIFFSANDYNGWPVDFTVQIRIGNTVALQQSFTNNTERIVRITDFSVTSPTQIRVSVTKWSHPNMRIRVAEIIAGLFEEWDDSKIAEFSLVHQANPASTSLPYGTATLVFDNTDHRFDPYNKAGLFETLEDRQGIDIYLGPDVGQTEAEFKKLGTFYQYANGWKIRSNLTITWTLVDIVGLLADRPYIVPSSMPITLSGWVGNILSQLGPNFASKYDIQGNIANTPVTTTADKLQNTTCGQVLLWLCQATCSWARANPERDTLYIAPIINVNGNSITFDNMISYPVVSANDDYAKIEFTLANGTKYTVAGNTDAASVYAINNPFISTTAQADATAAYILSNSGGNRIETLGRGDPTDVLGDILQVETETGTVRGRLIYADYRFRKGVLTSCVSKMIEVSAP